MATQTIAVGERELTVHVDGQPPGPAILHHHGTPLAGVPLAAWVEDVRARGARLVCYDRPGYGGSTRVLGRSVADAAADSAAIMDALGIEHFATWGISGGGPHALACAALLPDRVVAVASLAGIVPFDARGINFFRDMGADNRVEFGLAMAGREHLTPFCEEAAVAMRTASSEHLSDSIATLVSAEDREVLAGGTIGDYWVASMPATFAQGGAGWVDDDLAFVRPFGFDLGTIAGPVLVVHGRQDRFVPVAHGEWLAAAMPASEAWISDEEGHLTLMARRIPDVHAWLLDHF